LKGLTRKEIKAILEESDFNIIGGQGHNKYRLSDIVRIPDLLAEKKRERMKELA